MRRYLVAFACVSVSLASAETHINDLSVARDVTTAVSRSPATFAPFDSRGIQSGTRAAEVTGATGGVGGPAPVTAPKTPATLTTGKFVNFLNVYQPPSILDPGAKAKAAASGTALDQIYKTSLAIKPEEPGKVGGALVAAKIDTGKTEPVKTAGASPGGAGAGGGGAGAGGGGGGQQGGGGAGGQQAAAKKEEEKKEAPKAEQPKAEPPKGQAGQPGQPGGKGGAGGAGGAGGTGIAGGPGKGPGGFTGGPTRDEPTADPNRVARELVLRTFKEAGIKIPDAKFLEDATARLRGSKDGITAALTFGDKATREELARALAKGPLDETTAKKFEAAGALLSGLQGKVDLATAQVLASRVAELGPEEFAKLNPDWKDLFSGDKKLSEAAFGKLSEAATKAVGAGKADALKDLTTPKEPEEKPAPGLRA